MQAAIAIMIYAVAKETEITINGSGLIDAYIMVYFYYRQLNLDHLEYIPDWKMCN